ncbi:MAG: glutamate 5-kinase [Desulfobulbaceae bacterium]|nr:glutamate 5-kinase [Desulfobulbaceae bacterium]HIJ78224.1 glutamate 5-kinase [Deltaproteobacteria bacterium]
MTLQVSQDEGLTIRRNFLDRSKRVVVKVGSAVLTNSAGLNLPVLENLAREIHFLRQSGREVILVSSGAVAAGRRKLHLTDRALLLKEKQAAAAVGQSSLMRAYEKIFEQLGLNIAQVLLTHDDLSHRDRYLNIRNTLFTLLDWGLVPIINENDTVSVEELRFGDNDTLGAMVTNLTEADIFVCLTDVDGLYTANPATDPDAKPVYIVDRIDRAVEGMAGNVNSALGTGGMRSKVNAAKMVAARGGCSFIGPGRAGDTISRLFGGETVGTFFLPQEEKMASRKHWIAYTLRPKGFLVLDAGACKAVVERGKSLLPSGISEVRGKFGIGAPVQCLNAEGEVVAAGLVNYSSADIEVIKGVHTSLIEKNLGRHKDCDEVIHRDNLVVI